MITRTILHADLDAFYASVEQRDDPKLRGIPMMVGGGVVLAASYEARRVGVRTAMGGGEARRLCPGIVEVPARMQAYTEASKAVFEIFRDITPEVEPMSIDEAFLDVTGLRNLVGPAPVVAATLRRRVLAEVGLPISVGVASTKFLAKVASTVCKPDGLLVVQPGRELEFLHPLPVERLLGSWARDGDQAARQGAEHRGRCRRSGGGRAHHVAGKGCRAPLVCDLPQPGSPPGGHRPATQIHRQPTLVPPGRAWNDRSARQSFWRLLTESPPASERPTEWLALWC